MAQKLILIALSLCGLMGMCICKSAPTEHGRTPAQWARYLVHNADWVAFATISIQPDITGYPFAAVRSISDGPAGKSTGVPYFYMPPWGITTRDIEADNRISILATLAQGKQCEGSDAQEPDCGKVYITGTHEKVDNRTAEYEFAKRALFEKHPSMASWTEDHYVTKMNIQQIEVLADVNNKRLIEVALDDYFNVSL